MVQSNLKLIVEIKGSIQLIVTIVTYSQFDGKQKLLKISKT